MVLILLIPSSIQEPGAPEYWKVLQEGQLEVDPDV